MNPLYQNAIGSIESGNDYGALGPVLDSGDRAYGRYQVMGSNIPDWTEKHYGQRLTPKDFLSNKEAQDAVFDGEFGAALQKHGNPQDAASVWFSGKPMAQAGNASDGYNTVPQYVAKFNKALQSGPDAINAAAGIKPAGAGALSFASPDDEEGDTTDKGALTTNNTIGPGVLNGRVMSGDNADNKARIIGQGLTSIGAALAGISSPQQAYALNQQAAAMKKDNSSKYKIAIGKNGQIVRVDDSGNVDVVGGRPVSFSWLSDLRCSATLPSLATSTSRRSIRSIEPMVSDWLEGKGIMPTSVLRCGTQHTLQPSLAASDSTPSSTSASSKPA